MIRQQATVKTSCASEVYYSIVPKVMDGLEFKELKVEFNQETVGGRPVDVVSFVGKISNSNSFELNRKIHGLLENRNYNLILDLSRLEYINSSGVAIIFSLFQRVKQNQGKLAIGGMHPFLHNVFSLMDLPPRLDIYDTLDEARQSF